MTTAHTHPSAAAGGSAMSLGDSVYESLLRDRILFLGSQVDDVVANQLAAQMLLLTAADPHRDIHLYINSPGGSVTAGMAVYDTMQFIPCDVATYAMGMAASMGQFLLAAGHPGKRYALPNAQIMMHQPSAGVGGTAADIAIQAAMLRALKQRMTEMQAHHSGQTVERIRQDAERDRFFTAEQAREYGFVDHVLGGSSPAPGGPDAFSRP
ncbi:ATP-dependent Clp protease proteolytic subunit [Modestobacter sp. I12A-02628]|uniref:ATP-dependent Clp protease proteolytic subunit n=1 Tax=Goekera deserti TaxID=2497753 RepID=A0A7K3WAX6_9ACTN|nr:ATP-dependent Clp protease proteolytic subunit [Goekera deserti]MPQ97532.1 ATP-dependent Clp protease proteolytic subunit [Goekera deserti]NDI47864.1 ATP-dependent Clp protease proteolytic subunit [Goekera deserti]NEL53612.1 ATP-dependent Clp protease proteolytic subunit [Goekera deserti]